MDILMNIWTEITSRVYRSKDREQFYYTNWTCYCFFKNSCHFRWSKLKFCRFIHILILSNSPELTGKISVYFPSVFSQRSCNTLSSRLSVKLLTPSILFIHSRVNVNFVGQELHLGNSFSVSTNPVWASVLGKITRRIFSFVRLNDMFLLLTLSVRQPL